MSPRTARTTCAPPTAGTPRGSRTWLGRVTLAATLPSVLLVGLVEAASVEAAPIPRTLPSRSAEPAVAPSTALAGGSLAGQIGAPKRVKQMVTVTSRSWSSTTGTLKAWHRGANGRWRGVHGPVRVRLGYNGWVRKADRRQSTGTTPAGRFRLPYAFGRLANPGAHLNYRRFDRTDWWPYEPRDPATYNVWQWHKARTTRWRADKSEHLWDYYNQYAYGVVVGFNLPSGIHYSHRKRQWVADHRADTDRGGGIFLHVNGTGSTAGCVSMTRTQMRWLIRWLRPAGHPQLVMGPYSYVTDL
jgi:L,D-peptidoglycan transpeptidase YkuD (ErfK/YbiS/YcfS/YnhG family)